MVEDSEGLEQEAGPRPRRLRRAKRIGGGVALALALIAGGLWLERKPIADSFIARELAARGVQGRYEVTRIGPRTQRLDNLIIGDPRRPDLIARFVEVDVGWGFAGARITRAQASGVRLRGQLRNGSLSLGQVDRLLEGGEGEAELPDWTVEVDDARANITTDHGPIIFALQGRGPLRSGFDGTLGIAAASLQMGDCRAERLKAPLDLATENARILLKGPVTTPGITCRDTGLILDAPKLDLNLRSDLALKDLGGALSLYVEQAQQANRNLERLTGLVTFSGSDDELRGSASLSAASAGVEGVDAGGVKIGGNFALRPTGHDKALAWKGMATLDNARPAKGLDLTAITRAAAGTPLEPLAARLVQAIIQIGKANRVSASGEVNLLGSRGNAALNSVELAGANGARLRTAQGSALGFNWPDGAIRASGTIELAGGGLPEGNIAFATDPAGAISGTATLKPYAAGSARLALSPVRFSLDPAGRGRLSTVLTLDGPLPDGRLSGLTVPVEARLSSGGEVALAGDCAPVRWTMLRVSGLALDPASVRLCGIANGQIRLAATRLTGRLGDSPVAFAASSAGYGLESGRFTLDRPDVRIGEGQTPVRLAAARLTGRRGAGSGGLAGTIEGGAGRIGTVPLDLSEIAGRWTFADGRLAMDGTLRVADTQAERRFNPVAGRDVHLTLADNRIRATGLIVHPSREARVASVTIVHDLSAGAGQADFRLDSLRFGNALQPDDLTPLALGVVANVDGSVEGDGQIRWAGETVTSTGTFSTRGMSFAAAFGPVTGFATNIHFVDLLGLRTAPGQVLTMASVNPGIEVRDGEIRYALRSNEQAVIEGGRWPFSGGTLELLPATLDLDARKPRNLTFRVVGLDAGAFINTLELENISATGTFDGLLPMIFDAQGGRIEGGILVARQQGNPPLILTSATGFNAPCDPARQSGNLAYVGEVSNAQLGAYGKLAFDALKNLGYRCLTILLDGAIDGEFVTQVRINGVNQGTEEARNSAIARPFLGLPFLFNVRIEAPFRGLLNTAAGMADPSVLIRSQLGDQYAPVGAGNGTLAVQPSDSEKKIEGDRK